MKIKLLYINNYYIFSSYRQQFVLLDDIKRYRKWLYEI